MGYASFIDRAPDTEAEDPPWVQDVKRSIAAHSGRWNRALRKAGTKDRRLDALRQQLRKTRDDPLVEFLLRRPIPHHPADVHRIARLARLRPGDAQAGPKRQRALAYIDCAATQANVETRAAAESPGNAPDWADYLLSFLQSITSTILAMPTV